MTSACLSHHLFAGARISGPKGDFVHWSFKKKSGFLAVSLLTLVNRIPSDFHRQILCGIFFTALVLWAGELGLELKHLDPQGDLCS